MDAVVWRRRRRAPPGLASGMSTLAARRPGIHVRRGVGIQRGAQNRAMVYGTHSVAGPELMDGPQVGSVNFPSSL